ncbi:hypothetical protein SBA2_170033 [Acidobacteriia bacterium SbA2]|nr:hypothetical protein SBA2_170033 [Acidobacteriia bacterium SbA2]
MGSAALSPPNGQAADSKAGGPRYLALSCVNKRNYSEAWKGGALVPPVRKARLKGPLGPEANRLQGLKPPRSGLFSAAGLKPRPSDAIRIRTLTSASKH